MRKTINILSWACAALILLFIACMGITITVITRFGLGAFVANFAWLLPIMILCAGFYIPCYIGIVNLKKHQSKHHEKK
jgi:membrane protein implicated in regulation of membrane protease activity